MKYASGAAMKVSLHQVEPKNNPSRKRKRRTPPDGFLQLTSFITLHYAHATSARIPRLRFRLCRIRNAIGMGAFKTYPNESGNFPRGGGTIVSMLLAAQAAPVNMLREILGLLSIPALVGLNGFFVAAEFALVAVRKTRIE